MYLGETPKTPERREKKPMRRSIKKQIWMTKAEAQDLKKKAKKASMTEARLIRMLLEGYNPPEAPDERFYEMMDEMRKASDNLEMLFRITEDTEQAGIYHKVALDMLRIQNEFEKKYLLPRESDFKWQ